MKKHIKIVFCSLLICGVFTINLPLVFSQGESDVLTEEKADVTTEEKAAVSPEKETPVLPEEKAEVLTKESLGQIISLDSEKSTLVVKHLTDETTQTYEELVISVDSYTAIERDYEKVGLKDLAVGEEARIEYTTNAEGNNIASYISLKSRAEENK